jgi:competence protein ComEA
MKILIYVLLLSTLLFSAVDLNNASAKELSTLKKVSLKKAKKIVAYRKKHCFKSLKELKKVKGINKKKAKKILKKNKGNIALGECKEK